MPFFKGLNTSSINLQIMSTQGFKHNWYNSALEEHKSALKAQQYLAPLGLLAQGVEIGNGSRPVSRTPARRQCSQHSH